MQREKIWRQSPITINYDLYYESCEAVKNAIKDSKTVTLQNTINDCKGDQKKIFKIIDSLLGRKKATSFARIYLFILSCHCDKHLFR